MDIILEGTWDCADCYHKGNSGSDRVCSNCQEPRNPVYQPSEKVYLQPEAEVITDPKQIADAEAGADWTCGKCGQLNPIASQVCDHCGDGKDHTDITHSQILYTDHATSYDDPVDPRTDMAEFGLDEANRIMQHGLNKPRKIKDRIFRRGQLPASHDDVIAYELADREAEKNKFLREQEDNLPPSVRWIRSHTTQMLYAAGAIGMVIVIAAVWWFVHYLTATMSGTVTVTGLRWERSVEVEVYRTLTEADWDPPSDARIIGTDTRLRTYVEVTVGQRDEKYTDYVRKSKNGTEEYDCSEVKDLGNGKFKKTVKTCERNKTIYYDEPVERTRQVPITERKPVYDTWYTYEVDRWDTERWVDVSGARPQSAYWPEITLFTNSQPGAQIGEERRGDTRAHYSVDYVDQNGGTHSDLLDEADWNALNQGQTVLAEYYERNGELASVNW